MGSGTNVSQDDAFEIAASDTCVVNEDIVAIVGEVLGNGQRPRDVGAAVAKENGPIHLFYKLQFCTFYSPESKPCGTNG